VTFSCETQFALGATLKPDAGVTVTLAGPVSPAPGASVIATGTAGTVTITGPVNSGSGVLDVRAFGAVGDGATGSAERNSDAFEAAIAAAAALPAGLVSSTYGGAQVFVPPGDFYLARDLNIPNGVHLIGSGNRTTRLTAWSGGTWTNAVVTSGIGTATFLFSTQIVGIRINAAGQTRALYLAGWNENCTLRDVHVLGATTQAVRIEAASPPTTNITQNTTFERLRITTSAADCQALALYDVRQCTFLGLSIDQASTAAGGWGAGIKMYGECNTNLFVNVHIEDAKIPVDMSEDTSCKGNVFLGLDIQNPHFSPSSQTVGSFTGSMAVLNRQGALPCFTIQGYRNNFDYTYDVVDIGLATAVKFPALTGTIRYRQFYNASRTSRSVVADSDNVSVANVERLSVGTTAGNVTLGGLSGGVDGQVVRIIKTTQANDLIIEHNESTGDQKFICPGGTDITLSNFGGVTCVYNGSFWFVVAQ
jgi:hypothetical protein